MIRSIGYESVEPWPLDGLPGPDADPKSLRVEKMSFGGQARNPDKSVIVVNGAVKLSGIPEEAHRYEVNGRTALEWILDRYKVTVDPASRITNDPNLWSDDPHYIVDLVARIVRVSVESAAIVEGLPALGCDDVGRARRRRVTSRRLRSAGIAVSAAPMSTRRALTGSPGSSTTRGRGILALRK